MHVYLREVNQRDGQSPYYRLLNTLGLRKVKVLVADHGFHAAKMSSAGECTTHAM